MYEDEISRVAFADPDMVRHLLALLPKDAVAGLDARRLRRCRRPAELPGLAAALFGALRRDDRSELAERLSDALLRMLAARFGGNDTGAMTLATLLAPNVPHPSMSDGAAPLRRGAARRASIRAAS